MRFDPAGHFAVLPSTAHSNLRNGQKSNINSRDESSRNQEWDEDDDES